MGRVRPRLSRTDLNSPKRNFGSSSRILTARAEELRPHDQSAPPGVLISSREDEILYLNEAAQKLLDALGEKDVVSCRSIKNALLRGIFFDLLSHFKRQPDILGKAPKLLPQTPIIRKFLHQGIFHQVRSIPLAPRGKTRHDVYLLILIEKVIGSTARERRLFSDNASSI